MKCAYSQTIEIEENKELEALEKLRVEDGFRVISKVDERYIIVKNGLERLKKLDEFVKHYNDYKERICNLQFANRSLVEDNENQANEIYNLHERNDRLCDRLDKQKAKICKLEKAIELVKRIGIKEITIVNSFNDFNSYTEWYKKYFKENGFLNLDENFIPIQTEEEFNLLKEVFKNEN